VKKTAAVKWSPLVRGLPLMLVMGVWAMGIMGCVSGMSRLPAVELSAEAPYTKGTPFYEMTFHTTSMPGLLGGRAFVDAKTSLRSHPAPPGGEAAKAYHMVPAGMKLGEYLPLLPPAPVAAASPSSSEPAEAQKAELESFTIKIYWGCGPTVGRNQPRVLDLAKLGKGHDIEKLMAMARATGTQLPSGVTGQLKPGWAQTLWPNTQHSPTVSTNSSLVGEHMLHGNFVPHMRFTMTTAHDIMPALDISTSTSDVQQAITLSWNRLPTALGYQACAFAFNQAKREMILWISGQDPNTNVSGQFLSSAEVRRQIRKKNILPADQLQCVIPAGIFAGSDVVMATVTAWGSDYWAGYPEKPKNAPKGWKPDWTVQGRFMSSGMIMLGMPGAAQAIPLPSAEDVVKEAGKEAGKGLLSNILGGIF